MSGGVGDDELDAELLALRARAAERAGWRDVDWLRKALRLYVDRGSPEDPVLGVCPVRDLHAITEQLGAPPGVMRAERELTALRARVAELEEQVKEAVVRLARVPDMLDRERREGAEAMRERVAEHAERYVRRWSARYLPESIRALPLDGDPGEIPDAIRKLIEERDHLRARVDELEAERSEPAHVVVQMAYERGAEAMRERAAQVLDGMAALDAERAAKKIRALPLDADAGEDDGPNLCPGCYAAPSEPHPPYCPDAGEESER